MPKIVGHSLCVVQHGGLTIDELVGNAATKEDGISIARAVITEPSSEPWLTVAFDEWMCVLKGRVEIIHHDNNGEEKILVVQEGETCHASRGERFKPVFPVGNTEYILTCLPAFSPDRCVREDEDNSDIVAQRLRLLHEKKNGGDSIANGDENNKSSADDKIYHMCQKSLWDETLASRSAYFPPTFEKDGFFTHATAVATRLISTANHYYTSSMGDWICLELSIQALKRVGIVTRFEGAAPVGDTTTDKTASDIQWPHIYGGIPAHLPGIVTGTFPMKRDSNGTFVAIEGIVDDSKAKT